MSATSRAAASPAPGRTWSANPACHGAPEGCRGHPIGATPRWAGVPGAERLTAVRKGHIIPVEGQAILGGIQPIEALDGMADTLAALE